jgi:hypothetical protein
MEAMTVKLYSTVGFEVLALARGGHASHFLVKTPAKDSEKVSSMK